MGTALYCRGEMDQDRLKVTL